jgi:hypothetical protein
VDLRGKKLQEVVENCTVSSYIIYTLQEKLLR